MVDNDIRTRDHFLDGPSDATRDGELVVNLSSLVLPVRHRKEGFVSWCHLYISCGHAPPTTRRRGCKDFTQEPLSSCVALQLRLAHPFTFYFVASWKEVGNVRIGTRKLFLVSVIPKVHGSNQLSNFPVRVGHQSGDYGISQEGGN